MDRVSGGNGLSVLQQIEQGKYRPSKKLMDHVGNIIKGAKEYVLLDEQLVVYEKVRICAKKGFHDRRKTILIVKGGPGTGKSVIAINLMSDLLLGGYNAHYATGSKAFTETLRKVIGSRGSIQFKYFNSYGEAEPNEIDLLICDEAHRLRETSHSRFTPCDKRTGKAQLRELLDAAKVSVFFIDDKQVVRPNEIGSVEYIRREATASGCQLFEYQLEAQFRCAGSEGFVNWINNTLGLDRNANILWSESDGFEFRIFESPEALERAIRSKIQMGHKARMTAGFCWRWSEPRSNGTLVDDVEIGTYRRPWNAKPDAKKLAPGIPKASLWAYESNGIDQIGCVYTAQGFEFDYVGVIWGGDLTYNLDGQRWEGHPGRSFDNQVKRAQDKFAELVKNTYRVLLSRGMKGCYMYFLDKDTERFIRSRIENGLEAEPSRDLVSVQEEVSTPSIDQRAYPFRILEFPDAQPFVNSVPLYELKVAAGAFSTSRIDELLQEDEIKRPKNFLWAELPDVFRPRRGLFVAQVVGESMNRRIPNGAWCLFSLSPAGTRQGKVVLVQHRSINDTDTGADYTLKVYESEKELNDDGTWHHSKIILRPDSTVRGYAPIEINHVPEGELKVIAELIAVLG